MFWDPLVFEPMPEAEPSQINFFRQTINWPEVTGGVGQLGRTLAEKEQNGDCSVGHPLPH